uniref:Mos1 transposase HTH domain-containing protein n=1 Tax=Graphocephala atropunctata TaxID=36148 RepID=A0A1B6LZE7_9HEMI
MGTTINYSVNRELESVIRSLQAEGCSTAEIHRRMSVVYGEHYMSDSALRNQCRKFALYENTETKERSKEWILSLGKPKKFKLDLTKRKTMSTVFLGPKWCASR